MDSGAAKRIEELEAQLRSELARTGGLSKANSDLKLALEKANETIMQADGYKASVVATNERLAEENERLKEVLRSDAVNPDAERLNMIIEDYAKQVEDLHDALEERDQTIRNGAHNNLELQALARASQDRLEAGFNEFVYNVSLLRRLRFLFFPGGGL